ncbi:MAG TPA: urate hydroxylase PuuD [Candidatus Saccharimonadales bacterium]|nr:urate hydroxylase PuuD [Candidatus Saccharimonadales bacterium]
MAAFLGNLRNVVIAGFVLAAIVFGIYCKTQGFDAASFWPFFIRWCHVLCGIMWIGLLWYFNFVSTPTTPKIPEELRPALGKFITPAALFWFRWGAMGTIVFGLILAYLNGYLLQAITLDSNEGFVSPKAIIIGIGMWFGAIMWFNVWFIIWPNQQKALNIGGKYPDLAAPAKAAAGKTAGQFSRINTLLSIPMLFCMVAAQNIL